MVIIKKFKRKKKEEKEKKRCETGLEVLVGPNPCPFFFLFTWAGPLPHYFPQD